MPKPLLSFLLALVPLALAPAPASADPPVCAGGTVVTPTNGPTQLNYPSCTGAGPNPTVTIVRAPLGTLTGTTNFVYTPPAGFRGLDFFRYTVTNNDTHETS